MAVAWSVMIALGVVLALVVVARRVRRPDPVTMSVDRLLYCPIRHEEVTVAWRVAAWDNRPLDVERCSAFAVPSNVACDKICIGGSGRDTSPS